MLPNADLYTIVSGSAGGTLNQTLLFGADPQRVAILIWCQDASNGMSISPDALNTANQRIQLPGVGLIQLLWSQVGPVVQQAFYGSSMSPSARICWQLVSYRGT